jgi:hypothetical protein
MDLRDMHLDCAKTVCLIVDCQGFTVNGKFIPKEIAFTTNKGKPSCFEIDHKMSLDDLNREDRVSNWYITNFINDLPFEPKTKECVSISDVPALLRVLYNKHYLRQTDVFGIKNPQLGKLLDELKIPWLELQIPKMDTLFKYYYNEIKCNYHIVDFSERCALAKVAYIARWLNEKHKIDIILKQN